MATATRPEILGPNDNEQEEIVETESTSISKLEEADRSHMIRTAREHPRSITEFTKELTELACLSQPTAMSMIYSLPRAGKQIVGPSIRFAEAVIACWGNVRVGVEVIDVDRQGGFVTSEGRYYDCQKNFGFALRKRRRIVAKVINADSIQVTGDAGSSIALRDTILRGVPRAIWEPIWQKARETAAGSAKSMEELRGKLLQMFGALGITQVQIFNALGVAGPADLGPDQILAMNAWHKQLKEGEVTIEDIFGSPEDEEIQVLMDALQWNQTKQRMSREAYKGRRPEHLEYLRGIAARNGNGNGDKPEPIRAARKGKDTPPPTPPVETAAAEDPLEEKPSTAPPAEQPEAAAKAAPGKQNAIEW